ncbi:N-acylglucosamine 2-epimerase, partial [Cupriavidus sp. UYMSc13B]
MPISPELSQRVAALTAHYDATVLPLWTASGWNADLLLPYEALDGASAAPLPPARYRAMACARQLYVFSLAGDHAHADTLFGSLQAYFGNGEGAWIYSVEPAGTPLDATRDLYTHAFVIFACATYHARRGNPDALDVLDETVDIVEDRFADGEGLYQAALTEHFRPKGAGVLQNPVMHLTEAYLAALDATGDEWYAERLREIAMAVHERFVDPSSGCIAELPQGSPGNRIEPGHQFEWFSLVAGRPALFGDLPLADTLHQAFAFARRHGVERRRRRQRGTDADGSMLDDTQRIWAQTEYARARRACAPESMAALEAWTQQFRSRFLHGNGWHECLARSGRWCAPRLPSTSPYHLATSYSALAA